MVIESFRHITYSQFIKADVCQLVPATLSIFSCLLSIWYLLKIPKEQFKFRHMMIRILLFADLVRATLQFIFPWFNIAAITQNNYNSKFLTQSSFPFCDFIGFMISYCFDVNDFVMFVMAIHTALLIFKPSLSYQSNGEGGLARFTITSHLFVFICPIILNSIVYIDSRFQNFICFCYSPMQPVYIRIVSSWAFRFFSTSTIFAISFAVYIHIYLQYRNLQKFQPSYNDYNHYLTTVAAVPTEPGQIHAEEDDASAPSQTDYSWSLKNELYNTNKQKFNDNRAMALKNLKYIFVYPVSYFFIWLVPFIAQCYRFVMKETPIGLFCVVVFCQASDGVVQSLIFFFREKAAYQAGISTTSQIDDLNPGSLELNPVTDVDKLQPTTAQGEANALENQRSSTSNHADINSGSVVDFSEFLSEKVA